MSDDLAKTFLTVLFSGGGATLIGLLLRNLWKIRTGKMAAERAANTSIVNDRFTAIEERQVSDRNVSRLSDEVNRLRGLMLEAKLDPGPRIELESPIEAVRSRRRKATQTEKDDNE